MERTERGLGLKQLQVYNLVYGMQELLLDLADACSGDDVLVVLDDSKSGEIKIACVKLTLGGEGWGELEDRILLWVDPGVTKQDFHDRLLYGLMACKG